MSTNNTNLPSSDVAQEGSSSPPSETSTSVPSSGAGTFTEEQAAGVFTLDEKKEMKDKPTSILKPGKGVSFAPDPEGIIVQEGEYEDGHAPFSDTSSVVGSETSSTQKKPVLFDLRPIAPLTIGDPIEEENKSHHSDDEDRKEFHDDEYDHGYRPMGGNYSRDKKNAKALGVDNPTKKNAPSESKTTRPGKAELGKGHVREHYFIGEEVDYSVFQIETSAGALVQGPIPVNPNPLNSVVTELIGQVDYESFPLIARVEVKGGRIPVVTQQLNDLFAQKVVIRTAPVVSGVQHVVNFNL